jgi:3-methyladenine DNA glycosylase/8-oxoguanine DNA glycosylase
VPSRRVVLDGPADPVRTLRRLSLFTSDPTTRFMDGAAWAAFRCPEGTATVRYATVGPREIEVQAWGDGAEHALATAHEHLGADDRPESFVTDDPVVAPLLARFGGLRFGRTRRVLEALVPTILAQKVTGKGASRSYRDLVTRHGERAPETTRDDAPALFVPPSVERLRELAYFDFHPLGVERKRADIILGCVRRARRIEALGQRAPAEAFADLVKLPGVGPWTAAHVVNAALGDADAVAVGDYHLPHLVTFAFTGAPRGDDAQMLELLEPFRPHRGRVIAMLMAGGHSAPRYGPRLSVRDIRGQ